MGRKLPQNYGNRSASVGGGNPGTLLRSCLALLARLEGAAGPPGPTAALPQISPMEPITAPFPRAQWGSLGPGSPAQRSATTQRGRRAQQQQSTHHSEKDQSRFPPCGSSLESKGSQRVPRRSNSRFSRREPSLLVLWKKGSSSAIARSSFWVSNHSSSSLSAGMSAKDQRYTSVVLAVKIFWSTNKAACMLISRRGDNAHRQKQ